MHRVMPPTSHCEASQWELRGPDAAFVRTSVYQISKYPSGDMRIEYRPGSHPGGTNTLNALGNEIRHPGLCGATIVGRSRATIAARVTSSANVGSLSTAVVPSSSNARIGSSIGLRCTSSSDKSRYLPGAISKIQALSVCEPCTQGTQSERYFGNGRRFDVSTVVCNGMRGSEVISTLFYPVQPVLTFISSFIFSQSSELCLTCTLFSRNLRHVDTGRRSAPSYGIRIDVRRTKGEYCPLGLLRG
jgi:hypothetical protein